MHFNTVCCIIKKSIDIEFLKESNKRHREEEKKKEKERKNNIKHRSLQLLYHKASALPRSGVSLYTKNLIPSLITAAVIFVK